MTTAAGKVRLAPTVLDATTSARVIGVVILFVVVLAAVELTTNEDGHVRFTLRIAPMPGAGR